MSTVKEVIKASLGYNFPDATVDISIEERGLQPSAARDKSDIEQTKCIDLAKADLIDFLLTQPKSVRELDYQITQQDASALEGIRKRLLARWGITESDGYSGFSDLSNTH